MFIVTCNKSYIIITFKDFRLKIICPTYLSL
nr:MAG TPA: hypothetical protein [Bacteriophage sp.]